MRRRRCQPTRVYEPRTQVRNVVGSRRSKARQHRSQAFIPNPETIRGAWRKTCLLVMTPHTNDARESVSFAQIGVDVIASDDPRILLELRDSMRSSSREDMV